MGLDSIKKFVIKTICPKTKLPVLICFEKNISSGSDGNTIESTPRPMKIMGCDNYRSYGERFTGDCYKIKNNKEKCIYKKWKSLN